MMSNPFSAEEAHALPAGGYSPPGAPRTGGAVAAFKWGAIFGIVAGVVNALQVLIGALVVNANLDGIKQYETSAEFTTYMQCETSGNPSSCVAPTGQIPGTDSLAAILFGFYGTCLVVFLITLAIYLFAARAASRESGRRGAGVGAAVIAAVIGSLLYLVVGIVAVSLTGRAGLALGLGPFGGIDSSLWPAAMVRLTVIADIVGMLFAVGIGALMGLWGAALGMRGAVPPGYPPAVIPYGYPPMQSAPAPYPGAPQPPMMPHPQPYPYPGPPQPPMAGRPDYSIPAQYPPLPSHYETPPVASPPVASPDTPGAPPDPAQGGPA